MFRGSNAINLDAKGRLAMPARYRDRLVESCGGQLVATIALEERCLWIYPLQEWEAVEAQLRSAPNMNPAVKRLQRWKGSPLNRTGFISTVLSGAAGTVARCYRGWRREGA